MKFDSFSRTLLATVGPALACGVLYFAVFQRPLQQELQRQVSRLQKLEAAAKTADTTAKRTRLESINAQISNLEKTLLSSKTETSQLVALRSRKANSILGSAVPATSMTSMLETFERHGMRCISSQPVENPTDKIPEALQPVAQVLTSQKKDLKNRFEFQLVIVGNFNELRDALLELSTVSIGVQIISLAMEPIEVDTDPRVWTLTAVVWETNQ